MVQKEGQVCICVLCFGKSIKNILNSASHLLYISSKVSLVGFSAVSGKYKLTVNEIMVVMVIIKNGIDGCRWSNILTNKDIAAPTRLVIILKLIP